MSQKSRTLAAGTAMSRYRRGIGLYFVCGRHIQLLAFERRLHRPEEKTIPERHFAPSPEWQRVSSFDKFSCARGCCEFNLISMLLFNSFSGFLALFPNKHPTKGNQKVDCGTAPFMKHNYAFCFTPQKLRRLWILASRFQRFPAIFTTPVLPVLFLLPHALPDKSLSFPTAHGRAIFESSAEEFLGKRRRPHDHAATPWGRPSRP